MPKIATYYPSSKMLLGLALIAAMQQTPYCLADDNLAGQYYEDALVAYRKQEYDDAIIQLQNALQLNSKYIAAHILLGELYLQKKSLSAAEVHILKANELGADRSLTVKLLAQLYLYEIKYSRLLKEIDPKQYQPYLQPDLYVFRGHAFLQLNRIGEALNEYDMAARLDPERVDAIIGRANALIRRGDLNGADLAADKAMAVQANNAGTWYVKGSIKHAQTDLENAIKDYDRAIALQPDYSDARIARAGALMDLKQDERAEEDLKYLREHYPFDPKAAYLHAVLLERNGQKEASIKELEAASDIVIKVKPEYLSQHSQTLMLSALINYSLNRFDLAAEYLRQYIKHYPSHLGPYKLLATILLKRNEADQVIDLLKPLAARNPNDHRLLFLLGSAYMDVGKHDQANALLEKVSAADNINENLHTELGLNRLAIGQEDQAIEELESAIESDPGNAQAGIPLVAIYVKNGEAEKALQIAERLYQQSPKNLTLLNLLGTTQVATRNLKQARLSFEKAVEIDPSFITAHLNLSKLDVAENKADQAKSRLIKLNQQFPENIPVLLELSTIDQASGNYDEAKQWLDKAFRIDQKSMPVLLAQIDLMLKMRRGSEALQIAQTAELIDRYDERLMPALARCYLATDNREKAIGVYRRMVEQARFNVRKIYTAALYQIDIGDYYNAIKTLKKAVLADKKHIPSQIALTEMELYHGEPVFARNRAKDLLEQYPDRAFPYRLLGDIAMKDGDFGLAASRYQSAFQREPNANLMMKLYQSLNQSGQNDRAFDLLEQWIKNHPKDHAPLMALAEELLQRSKTSQAQKHYEFLLSQYPDDPRILNNLAYIYFESGNDNALAYAEKARKLAPEQVSTNDTLGWILVNTGKVEEGLHYLRNAQSRMAQNPEVRYHIAVALNKLQRKEEAKLELEQALKSNVPFNGSEQAKALLQQLEN
ncbi:XrtA/PEP-CTERM system TPR-repeat protein PrsT [Methylomonas sp. MgM2]